jgi:hypothetical protein
MPAGRVRFAHAGRDYVLPPWRDWPLAVMVDLGRGDVGAFGELLGAEEFEQLCDDGFTFGQFSDVLAQASALATEEAEQAAQPKKAAARRPFRPWSARCEVADEPTE